MVPFKVVRQQLVPDHTDASGQSDAYHVHFVTAAGTEGKVVVPMSDYTAAIVKDRIGQRASQVHEVDRLGHDA